MENVCNDEDIEKSLCNLREKVTAAQHEFDMAITFHEVWKPAAYDHDLHSRMSRCYAGQAFLVIRTALRREMLLALMRIWDTNKQALRMTSFWEKLRDERVINALARDRVENIGLPEAIDQMRADLELKASAAILLLNKYMQGGSHNAVFVKLRDLRNEQLAHRDMARATVIGANATEEEIEEFYQDTSKLINILLSLVNAIAYDPDDTAGVYQHYARHFWLGVRGEQTAKVYSVGHSDREQG